jgi:DNA-binding CsgD family transcriptional regulator
MSKNENITIKLKYSKIKNFEKICFYFSQDYTATQTAQEMGISRQTINNYYKILRDKLNEEFIGLDNLILEEISTMQLLNIRYINIYKTDIFYIICENKIIILNESVESNSKLNSFIQTSVKDPLSKHKRANCARVLKNKDKETFLVSVFLKKEDNTFEDYLQTRLNQFRGINKEKLFSYLKESQIRYNSSPSIIYQKIILNLKSN